MSPLELFVAKLHIWRYKPQIECSELDTPMVLRYLTNWKEQQLSLPPYLLPCVAHCNSHLHQVCDASLERWSKLAGSAGGALKLLNFHMSLSHFSAVFFRVLFLFFLPSILTVRASTKGKVHITLVAIRSAISVKMPFHKRHPQVNFQILQSDPVGCPNRDQLLGIEVTLNLAADPRS